MLLDVMLVDDDLPVLGFLERVIPWKSLDLRLAGRFENGVKAYEYASQNGAPDLLITDIGMPQMNGLELIRKLQLLNDRMRVIILSCHDEFAYAQEAIKLGVDDYVLKETIDPPSMIQLLKHALERIERQNTTAAVPKKHHHDHVHGMLRKQQFIRSVLYHPVLDVNEWRDAAKEFGIHLGSCMYTPVVLAVDRFGEVKDGFVSEDNCAFAVGNIVEEVISRFHDIAVTFNVTHSEHLLLMKPSEECPHPDLLREIGNSLRRYLKVSVSFFIGKASRNPLHLRMEMQRIVNDRRQRFFFPEGRIHELPNVDFSNEDLFVFYIEAQEQFNRIFLEQQEGRIGDVLSEWAGRIRSGQYPPEVVKEWFAKLLFDLHITTKSLDAAEGHSPDQILQRIYDAERFDHVIEVVDEALHHASVFFRGVLRRQTRPEIVEAKRYVELNIHRKISLEEVARHLHLNASYFSRLFKKETQETFMDYVTRTKMSKAKEMLILSKYTMDEIAYRLGYDNKSYFMKLFKTHMGYTPKAYARGERESNR